jgi:hypothetical protein
MDAGSTLPRPGQQNPTAFPVSATDHGDITASSAASLLPFVRALAGFAAREAFHGAPSARSAGALADGSEHDAAP